ncbi:hypothetical protein PoB_004681100 [Plakobranchus ocellatus]|uniref:Uncharacterized protein n=1 Tax=Plakobranchus ocellatus TaxID=259542 RepID=A0AAV4BAD5_9GAST|nr:hypothetical protein PoB_004681100 [Plakobranchus ocellatus]
MGKSREWKIINQENAQATSKVFRPRYKMRGLGTSYYNWAKWKAREAEEGKASSLMDGGNSWMMEEKIGGIISNTENRHFLREKIGSFMKFEESPAGQKVSFCSLMSRTRLKMLRSGIVRNACVTMTSKVSYSNIRSYLSFDQELCLIKYEQR